MTAFYPVPYSGEKGGHLLAVLPEITVEAMEARWGDGHPLGGGEDGYEVSWIFESKSGTTFEVYTRYGVVRVGGKTDPMEFLAYLRESLLP